MDRYQTLLKEVKKCAEEFYKNRPSWKKDAFSILEIGTWNGDTAIKMCKTAHAVNKEPIMYVGFDLFEKFLDHEKEHCPKKPLNIDKVEEKFKLHDFIKSNLYQGNTNETLRTLYDFEVDFIWFDGGHSIETIANDWAGIQQFIKEQTVILIDDYYYDSNLIEKYGTNGLVYLLQQSPNVWDVNFLQPIDDHNGGTQIIKVRKHQNE